MSRRGKGGKIRLVKIGKLKRSHLVRDGLVRMATVGIAFSRVAHNDLGLLNVGATGLFLGDAFLPVLLHDAQEVEPEDAVDDNVCNAGDEYIDGELLNSINACGARVCINIARAAPVVCELVEQQVECQVETKHGEQAEDASDPLPDRVES